MTTRENLEKETGIFFDRHWDATAIPAWNFSWDWCGAVPNHDSAGVYALFSGDTLVHLGLGTSHGNRTNHGIGRRLLAHAMEIAPVDASVSYIPEARWRNAEVDRVATIGFPQESAYLACALENYLIEKLDPPGNHLKHPPKHR